MCECELRDITRTTSLCTFWNFRTTPGYFDLILLLFSQGYIISCLLIFYFCGLDYMILLPNFPTSFLPFSLLFFLSQVTIFPARFHSDFCFMFPCFTTYHLSQMVSCHSLFLCSHDMKVHGLQKKGNCNSGSKGVTRGCPCNEADSCGSKELKLNLLFLLPLVLTSLRHFPLSINGSLSRPLIVESVIL